jgi:hypothetical protein
MLCLEGIIPVAAFASLDQAVRFTSWNGVK